MRNGDASISLSWGGEYWTFSPGHQHLVVVFLWDSRLSGLAFGSYLVLLAGPLLEPLVPDRVKQWNQDS